MSDLRQPDDLLPWLVQLAERLGGSSDIEEILTRVIDALCRTLDAERATVFEHDAASAELFSTVAHGLTQVGDTTEIRLPVGAGLVGESARRRSIVNVPDAYADDRFNRDVDRRTGFRTRSVLAIPLVDHDQELVGVAQVLNKRTGAFDERDEQAAAAIAVHAALAIRRARLIVSERERERLERDLEAARRIQQASFPRELPETPGFEIAAFSEPAEQTGGDAYDALQRGDGRIVMMMADATGHGIGPALSVTQLRSMFRMAARLGTDLKSAITHFNAQLVEDLPLNRFITAWFGELDERNAMLHGFSAGQGPLAHVTATGVRWVDADVPPLGIFDPIDVVLGAPVALAPGDVFAAISDGVYEAGGPNEELFGEERVAALLEAHRDRPAPEQMRILQDAVEAFTGGLPSRDDETILLVRRLP